MDFDDAFANMAHIPGSDALPAQWARDGAAFRETASCLLDLAYGTGERERYDLFLPARLAKGAVIFVHGGYWRSSDRSDWSYLAAGAVAQGWAVAMPSYDLCPKVGIDDITRQIHRAIGVIAERVPGPLRITGHSAGGHLAARMLDPDLRATWHDRLERVMPISAVTDLEPLLQTQMNADFGLDLATARAESPVRQPAPDKAVTICVGGNERPVFVQQSQALAAAWDCACVVEQGRHHFDVLDGLRDPDHPMTRALLA